MHTGNRNASVSKGAPETWFPKLVSIPARWVSDRFAQMAKGVKGSNLDVHLGYTTF